MVTATLAAVPVDRPRATLDTHPRAGARGGADQRPAIRFRLLGPVEVVRGDRLVTPRARKVRILLAALLLRCNSPVSIDALIEILWGDAPPRTALQATRVYVSQLRQLLAGPDPGPYPVLRTLPAGYRLDVDASMLDTLEFQQHSERARQLYREGSAEQAAEHYRSAIALWRGPALADVRTGSTLESAAVQLEEAYIAARERRIDIDLRLHRHRDLVAELSALIGEYPLNEGLHARLMIALYRTGRTSEALGVYRNLHHMLVEEIGVEPCPQLRLVHQAVLAADLSAIESMDLWTI
jgi:DNA-binding SARP family transcriptional activator